MCWETAFKSFSIVFDWVFGCIKSDREQFGRRGKVGNFYSSSLPFFYLVCSYFCSVIASLFQTTPVWPSYFLSLVHNHSSISPSLLPTLRSFCSSRSLVCRTTIAGFILIPFLSLAHLLNLCACSLVSVMLFVSEPLCLCSVILVSLSLSFWL